MHQLTLSDINAALAPAGLKALGSLRVSAKDALPDGVQSLVLVGPTPQMWPIFKASPFFNDGAPDPLDRWSTETLPPIARAMSAEVYFPFGGPPYNPFIGWALRTDTIWSSPVGLLVHETDGLFVSFRAALGLPDALPHAPAPARPCDACPAPCKDACPVSALGEDGYDVPLCKEYIRTEGEECLTGGCKVRRACPIGQNQRQSEQSGFHMAAFI